MFSSVARPDSAGYRCASVGSVLCAGEKVTRKKRGGTESQNRVERKEQYEMEMEVVSRQEMGDFVEQDNRPGSSRSLLWARENTKPVECSSEARCDRSRVRCRVCCLGWRADLPLST